MSNYTELKKNTPPGSQLVCSKCQKFHPPKNGSDDINFISCACCQAVFHSNYECSGLEEHETYNFKHWYCPLCFEFNGDHVLFEMVAPHRLEWESYAPNESIQIGSNEWTRQFVNSIDSYPFPDNTALIEVVETGTEFLNKTTKDGAFVDWKKVYLVKDPVGLNMKLPSKDDFTIEKVSEIYGLHEMIEVVDSLRQETIKMKMGTFAEKWTNQERELPLNALSINLSTNDALKAMATPPEIFTENSFVRIILSYLDLMRNDTFTKFAKESFTEKCVESYMIGTMRGSFTNCHIDASGSSVFFHVVSGHKVFLLAPPTEKNLATYRKYDTKVNTTIWLADDLELVKRVDIREGETAMIPGGWIHAVWTPVDTVAYSGNFLHIDSFAIQIKVKRIEKEAKEKRKLPENFSFFAFEDVQWAIAETYFIELIRDCTGMKADAQKSYPQIWENKELLIAELKKWLTVDEECAKNKDAGAPTKSEIKKKKFVLQKFEDAIRAQEQLKRDRENQPGPSKRTLGGGQPDSPPSRRTRQKKN